MKLLMTLIAVLASSVALAHTDGIGQPGVPLEPVPDGWYWDIWFDHQLFTIMLLPVLLYTMARIAWKEKDGPFPAWQVWFFMGGIALFYLSVSTSLDEIGEKYLFMAHMLQHNIIIYGVALLLVLGLNEHVLSRFLDNPVMRPVTRFFVHPLSAFLLFNLCFVFWHIPFMYEWALRDERIHDLEHFSFLILSVTMWWPVYSPMPKVAPGIRLPGLKMLYVFALAVAQLPLFAYLSFAEQAHYPTYRFAPRITEMSPLDDQFVGGILMKVFAMAVFLAVWAQVFYSWARSEAGPPGEVE